MKRWALILLGGLLPGLLSLFVLPPGQALAVDCWTTFIPSSPHGAPMVQYYRNCSSVGRSVMPFYRAPSGTTVFSHSCQYAGPGVTVTWYHPSTVPSGAQYGTAVCASGPYTYSWSPEPSWNRKCNTSFIPSSPQGGAMVHYYRNCSDVLQWVTTAWRTSNGNLYADPAACVPLNPQTSEHVYEGRWYYSSTVPTGASYTTVRCDLSILD